jgi:hypothetical protein
VGKFEGKKRLSRPWHGRNDNIKIFLKRIGDYSAGSCESIQI